MSDLRIALVAEGETDTVIIEAALTAVLGSRPFILTQLQPEKNKPAMGAGWGGVLKWCHAANQRHAGSLDDDPTLQGFDLLIIQLDVDVAGFRYADYGPEVAALAVTADWHPLPCVEPCPPPTQTVTRLASVLNSWLGNAAMGSKTMLCMPAQASGTWLAAAVLPPGHKLSDGIECNVGVESGLTILPKGQRIRKTVPQYRAQSPEITSQWSSVKAQCGQAVAFERAVLARL
jgi:hypothetical protein